MTQVVNNKKLELKLTQYGLDRITDLLNDPTDTLSITKIRIGSGKDNEYYHITDDMLADPNFDLQGPIGNYEFYIYDKQLLEDGLTVSFHTVIPEDVGGFDIREVGLYETTTGLNGPEDHLFAISTQQPFVKPDPQYNYFISINYYMFLKIQDFAEVYDRITLDIEHTVVSEPDLEAMMKTFLFAQENLINQIGKNSEIIGYNRPTQLLEKVNENKTDYSYITLYKNFASVLDLVESPDNIISYWIFDYSRRESLGRSITDLSKNRYYLETNQLNNFYPRYYRGFQSMLSFTGSDYYKLSSQIPINLYDPDTDKDSPFTMAFALEPNGTETRTLLAKCNFSTDNTCVFEIQELANNSLRIRLYANQNLYLEFVSAPGTIPQDAHSLVLTYDPEIQQMKAFVNAEMLVMNGTQVGSGTYTHMNTSANGKLYKYQCVPTIYASSNALDESPLVYEDGTDKTVYCEKDGTPVVYQDLWFYNGTNLLYQDIVVNTTVTATPVMLYAWVYTNGGEDVQTIYTEQYPITSEYAQLYDENLNHVDSSTDGFHIKKNDKDQYLVMYGEQETNYTHSENIVKYISKYECPEETQYIYTTTNDILGLAYPLYTNLTGDDSNPVFQIYNGIDWTFQTRTQGGVSSYVLCYDNEVSELVSDTQIGKLIPELASYVISSEGRKEAPINSKVGLISIIKEKLSDTSARVLALNLCATMGQNPFLSGD